LIANLLSMPTLILPIDRDKRAVQKAEAQNAKPPALAQSAFVDTLHWNQS